MHVHLCVKWMNGVLRNLKVLMHACSSTQQTKESTSLTRQFPCLQKLRVWGEIRFWWRIERAREREKGRRTGPLAGAGNRFLNTFSIVYSRVLSYFPILKPHQTSFWPRLLLLLNDFDCDGPFGYAHSLIAIASRCSFILLSN